MSYTNNPSDNNTLLNSAHQSVITEELDQEDTKQKMGRGKIQIKLIENSTNRQVTYSKRRNGILKKAHELTVLCDAKVFLIMISKNRLCEYLSPGLKTKDILDLYQNSAQIDLWKTQYEAMQQTLQQLKEKNYELRREIRQRLGHDLDDLSYPELCDLEHGMSSAVDVIRERKEHKIKNQTETTKKKVKSLKERNTDLMQDFIQAKFEDPPYGLVDNEGGYEAAVALANGASNLYAFRHHSTAHSAIHGGEGFDPYDLRDLRLA